jgi:hypothetical protein
MLQTHTCAHAHTGWLKWKDFQPIPDMFCLSNKFQWYQKTKNSVILKTGNDQSVKKFGGYHQNYCHLTLKADLFVSVPYTLCIMEMVYQTKYCQSIWNRRIG